MARYSKIESSPWKEHDSSPARDSSDFDETPIPPRRTSRIALHCVFLAINLLVLSLNAYTWLAIERKVDPHYPRRPFDVKAIYLNNGTLNPHKANSFNGPPRESLENAWDKLMKHQNVRVPESELGQYAGDDSIVKLTDGSGYYTTVAVFHGLHCVQRLHHAIYADHYYPGLSEDETFLLKRHTEHCIDWLRQYVQCNADTTLIPIQWAADSPGPVSTDKGKHQCVVWEPIYEWMAEHSFDPFEPGLLVHPTLAQQWLFSSSLPDPYHPETLEPGRNTCHCGNTIKEALARGCVYDTMATAWLPPYCRDEKLTAEFDKSGPGPNGQWSYFADKAGIEPLTTSQMAGLGETGGSFWASRDWHIVHCLFYWQKYVRMRETGVVMEERFDSLDHVKHCSRLIRNPIPDHFFLIEVPVRMNSSMDED
ncbi:hypothetical protein CP533_3436 [Ophiocordyceps camponoti-saundersi (nom. inval.)]|nr:hypothetical protein CP533_3436 [Ophiocordyceps camponoti-saundersi (nom. inval.)]